MSNLIIVCMAYKLAVSSFIYIQCSLYYRLPFSPPLGGPEGGLYVEF